MKRLFRDHHHSAGSPLSLLMALWMEVKIMRFDIRQLIERLALALGMAVAGLVLLGAVARSQAAPILAEHLEAGDRVAAFAAPAQRGDHQKLAGVLGRTR
jgi:hypothetical protein